MGCVYYHHDAGGGGVPHRHLADGSVVYGEGDHHHHAHPHGSPRGSDDEQSMFFDDCAAQGLMGDFEPEEQSRFAEVFASWCVRDGMQVLEPGCGQGRVTELLARSVGTSGKVLACDLSGKMLALASSRLSAQGLLSRVELFHGSVLDMPLPVGSVDRVIMFSVFPHFSDKAAVLSLALRCLRVGGELWICHLHSRDEMNEFHRHAGQTVSDHVLPDEAGMRVLVEAAGLSWVSFEERSGLYCVRAQKD